MGTTLFRENVSKGRARTLKHRTASAAISLSKVERMLALQRSVGNAAISEVMRAAAPDAGAVVAVDADIEALDLSATAKAAAADLRKKHPTVVFTSGRRNPHDQAHAMATNIVSSNNRHWIADTYAAAASLQHWVDQHPEATTVDQLTAGLNEIITAMSDVERAKVSKHLSGDAFDVQPVTADADAIKSDIRSLPGLSRFLDHEGGLTRWHAQF